MRDKRLCFFDSSPLVGHLPFLVRSFGWCFCLVCVCVYVCDVCFLLLLVYRVRYASWRFLQLLVGGFGFLACGGVVLPLSVCAQELCMHPGACRAGRSRGRCVLTVQQRIKHREKKGLSICSQVGAPMRMHLLPLLGRRGGASMAIAVHSFTQA